MKFHDDTYYIDQVLKGNINAFSHLVDKYKRMAYTLALKLVQVPEDAEEIAQDAFLKAYQALDSFKGESKFSTWLFKIIYNASIARLRKKQLNTFSLDDEGHNIGFDVSGTDDLLTQLDMEEQNAMVRAAIDQLDAEEKALVTLYYMEDNSVKEIAYITEDTEANVKIKLFRARKKLWQKLKYHFNDKTIIMAHE